MKNIIIICLLSGVILYGAACSAAVTELTCSAPGDLRQVQSFNDRYQAEVLAGQLSSNGFLTITCAEEAGETANKAYKVYASIKETPLDGSRLPEMEVQRPAGQADVFPEDEEAAPVIVDAPLSGDLAGCENRRHYRQVSVFVDRQRADNLRSTLSSLGHRTVVCDTGGYGMPEYSVYLARKDTLRDAPTSPWSGGGGENTGIEEQKGEIGWDVYGRRGGYIHPFLSVTAFYTDNVFNTQNNKKSDTILVLSPGVWLALPALKTQLKATQTKNTVPGGLLMDDLVPETFRRFQTYFYYRADSEHYTKYTKENTLSHTAEAVIRYALRGGLVLEVLDSFLDTYDTTASGTFEELTHYNTNMLSLRLTYNLSERLSLRGSYSNFTVDYDRDIFTFLNRTDQSLAGYVFYKVRPSLTVFAEYEVVDVDYDQDIMGDNTETRISAGALWRITAKTSGALSVGRAQKDYESDATVEDWIATGAIRYKISPKTSIELQGSRGFRESTFVESSYVITDELELKYQQSLTSRITLRLNAKLTWEDFSGELTEDGVTAKRDDEFLSLSASLQYRIKRWLTVDLGIIHSTRESTFEKYTYDNNTMFLRLSGAM